MGPIKGIAISKGIPLVDLMLRTIRRLGLEATLLAVCPNSEAVTKAAIIAARSADAPMLYAATLNQVDLDGGYTGWTPKDLARLVRRFTADAGFKCDIAICSDHCGPYCKDVHSIEKWPVGPAMWGVAASCVASMQAGYDLLHIDPTIDRTLPPGEHISIETVVDRTLTLISAVERSRRRGGYPPISYEVGTEEVHGGLADVSVFREFLDGLKSGLARLGLSDVWPVFVVGKVGTDLHTTEFDPEVASTLVSIAAEYGSFIKGHYTDNCTNLEAYPAAGMGGANVGPEFTMAEYEALMELVEEEARLAEAGKAEPSGVKEALTAALVDSGRWKRWLLPDEEGKPFDALSTERKDWLTQTGCRYIWTTPGVRTARAALYDNLAAVGIDADKRVVDAIATVIRRYIDKFNLGGLQSRLLEALSEE
ncbi:MAG: class II D-tagatose-bisphosphate aldolase non-catalytic subunit [Planctomycetota bacterium]|jgi:tagatose-1,6-bisphosphate aldolase non-catalytic subunit AgaZ/GatZ